MADLSDYLEEKLSKAVFGLEVYSASTNLYVALFTTVPNEANSGGVEPSGGSYARVAVATGVGNGWAWDGSTVDNDADVNFPAATGDWGNIVGVGLFDAATLGNLLCLKTISTKAVNNLDTARFQAGDIDFSLN